MEEETQSLFHWAEKLEKMDIEQGGNDGQGRQRGGDKVEMASGFTASYVSFTTTICLLLRVLFGTLSASTLVSQSVSTKILPKTSFYKVFLQQSVARGSTFISFTTSGA